MTHSPYPWAEDGLSRRCCQDFAPRLPAKVSQHEYLSFAIEMRRRVKERLKRMGGIE